MRIVRRAGWEIPEHEVTPEAALQGRRAFGRRGVIGGAAALAALGRLAPARAETYPAGRPVTDEKAATTYNNFYEFGEDKDIWQAAQALRTDGWSVDVGGLVGKPRRFSIDDLMHAMPMQERVYRHRCVEAWAMTVPWTGFPLSALVKAVEPTAEARYLVFTTVQQDSMPGLSNPVYPWPYQEGCTLAEAQNDLAFLATGMYGKTLPKQDGAPIRLLMPWKYGFKSAKSIVKIEFVAKQPSTFWAALGPNEYGFWANVNPDVPHPRWSQASERLLGTGERVPTRLYNGYGEFVAPLYAQLKDEALFR